MSAGCVHREETMANEARRSRNVVDFGEFRAAQTRRTEQRGQLGLFDEPARATLGRPRSLSARQEAHRAAMLAHLRRDAR